MSIKTLKTKRKYFQSVHNHLKRIPPKDYPTTEEIKVTIEDILPEIAPEVEGYTALIRKAENLSRESATGKIDKVQVDAKVLAWNEEWRKYESEHGDEMVEIKFTDNALKVLKDQFTRENWGKNWFVTIQEYTEFSNNLDGKFEEEPKAEEVKEEVPKTETPAPAPAVETKK